PQAEAGLGEKPVRRHGPPLGRATGVPARPGRAPPAIGRLVRPVTRRPPRPSGCSGFTAANCGTLTARSNADVSAGCRSRRPYGRPPARPGRTPIRRPADGRDGCPAVLLGPVVHVQPRGRG